MITITLTEKQASCLFDEMAYAKLPHSRYLNRYERALSQTATVVQQQLTDQGVDGRMAANENARF